MIHGLFPERINLNCISTGLRSGFLSPFYRLSVFDTETHSEHEYISTMQIHLRLQFAISRGLEIVFINILNASNQSINLNTKLGGSMMLLQAFSIGHEGIMCILLERSFDVNAADGYGRTALLWASKNGHGSVVKLLLQSKGIDINSRSNDGRTALSWASQKGHDSVAKLLLQEEGIDINSKDNYAATALSYARINGKCSTAQLLLTVGAIDRRKPRVLKSQDKKGR
jgi:ankyrin repeat protein